MLWRYSRRDTKVLLLATLLTFTGFSLALLDSWHGASVERDRLTASTVGVFAGVEENRVNTLAYELDQRALDLEQREAALATAERGTDPRMLMAVTLLGGAMFGLIMLNFYLDHKHRLAMQ